MVTPEFVDAWIRTKCRAAVRAYTTCRTIATCIAAGTWKCRCTATRPAACRPAATHRCGGNGCVNGCQHVATAANYGGNGPMITDGLNMPGGVGYDESYEPTMAMPTRSSDQEQAPQRRRHRRAGRLPETSDQPMPIDAEWIAAAERRLDRRGRQPADGSHPARSANRRLVGVQAAIHGPRPYSPPRQPVFMRNASNPNNPHASERRCRHPSRAKPALSARWATTRSSRA